MAVSKPKLLSYLVKEQKLVKPLSLFAINKGDDDKIDLDENFLEVMEDKNIVLKHERVDGKELLSILDSGGSLFFYSPSDYFIYHEDDKIDLICVTNVSNTEQYHIKYLDSTAVEDYEYVSNFEDTFSDTIIKRFEGTIDIKNFIWLLCEKDPNVSLKPFDHMHFIAVSADGKKFFSFQELDKDIFSPVTVTETKQTKGKEDKIMANNVKTTAVAVAGKNKTAAIAVARMTAGKVAMEQVTKVIKPKLPMMARGYAETPLGKLVMANLFNFAITQYLPENKKAIMVADVMLEGAMLEAMSSLNIEEQLNNILDSVDVSKIAGSKEG